MGVHPVSTLEARNKSALRVHEENAKKFCFSIGSTNDSNLKLDLKKNFLKKGEKNVFE